MGICPCCNYIRAYWADLFQISLVACPEPYTPMSFPIKKKNKKKTCIPIFHEFDMGPYENKNFKTLLLPQIAFEFFQLLNFLQ